MGSDGEPMSVVDALQLKIKEASGASRAKENVALIPEENEDDSSEYTDDMFETTDRRSQRGDKDPLLPPVEAVCICQVNQVLIHYH